MRVGITLPTFEQLPSRALLWAMEADDSGLDGVFSYDHLWPIGQPERPALATFPMLGAVAAATSRIRIGSLVARIGLQADAVVVDSLESLQVISSGRLVAALGVGDAKSVAENDALGVALAPVKERRRSLAFVLDRLVSSGIECWVGAGAPSTQAVARRAGVAVNLWAASPVEVEEVAAGGEVTWAGPLPRDAPAAAVKLGELARAGASWAIWAAPPSVAVVVEAAQLYKGRP